MNNFARISDNSIEKIGEIITSALATADSDWKKPWITIPASPHPAANLSYKRPFSGMNDFFLNILVSLRNYKTPYFLTFQQITDLGLKLNIKAYRQKSYKDTDGKWQRSTDTITPEEYASLTSVEQANYYSVCESPFPVFLLFRTYYNKKHESFTAEQYNKLSDEEKEECRSRYQLKVYNEWNLDQTDFAAVYPDRYNAILQSLSVPTVKSPYVENASDPVLDYILTQPGGWRCPITHDGVNRAYYSPSSDSIHLPEREHFISASSYYGTAIHECTHSNKKECHRDFKSTGFGSEGYATEELVAELSSAIMLHDIGIEKTIDKEHLQYVNSWKSACKNKDVIRSILDHLMASVSYNLRWYEKCKATLSASVSDVAS